MSGSNQKTKSKEKQGDQVGTKVTSNPPANYTKLPEIIGIRISPVRGDEVSLRENLLRNSTLTIDISPCIPDFKQGLGLFKLDKVEGWNQYKKFLNKLDITPNPIHDTNNSIRIAALAENFPQDTFSNDYGESFLGQITDVGGKAFGQIAQIMGAKSATEAVGKMGGAMKGTALEGIGDMMISAKDKSQGLIAGLKSTGLKNAAKMVDQLLAGARIDFPQVWMGSSYSTSYSFTIRLYNPKPSSDKSTEEHIIGPLASILALGLPQAYDKDNISYNYPFFCQVSCPGLFTIPSGGITSITVVKGGDQGLIGMNQRVGLIDIRIDMVNLYTNMILSDMDSDGKPTIKSYLDNLRDKKELEQVYKTGDYGSNEINLTGLGGFIDELVNIPHNTQTIINDSTAKAPSRTNQEDVDKLIELITDVPAYNI